MDTIYLDIETLPTFVPRVMSHIKQTLKPPGTIKRQESIDKWLEDPANLDKALNKTGLSGLFGTIACIGIATDTGDVTILKGDERNILEDLATIVRFKRGDGHIEVNTLVGHNAANFDVPFINQRMLVHGMGPLFPHGMKKWDKSVNGKRSSVPVLRYWRKSGFF